METDLVLSEIDAPSKSAIDSLGDGSVPPSEEGNFVMEEVASGTPILPEGDLISVSEKKALPSSSQTKSSEGKFSINSIVTSETVDKTSLNDSALTSAAGSVQSPVNSSIKDDPATLLEAVPSLLVNTDSTQAEEADNSSIQSNSEQSVQGAFTSSMETDCAPSLEAVPSPSLMVDATPSAETVKSSSINVVSISSAEAISSPSAECNSAPSLEDVSTPLNNVIVAPSVKADQSLIINSSSDNDQSDAQSLIMLTSSDIYPKQTGSPSFENGQTSSQSVSATDNGGHGTLCPRMELSENNTASKSLGGVNGSVDGDILVIDVVGADAYRETAIVIGDSDEESWTSDSDEDSSSDEGAQTNKTVESSSSDSTSDEDDDKEEENLEDKQARLKEKELIFKKNQTKRDSKNCRLPKELQLTDLPCIEDLQISVPEEEAQAIGEITGFVDELVIVDAYDNLRPIDLDSVLFLKQGSEALGKVFDVMGCVNKPSYCVRFNNKDHIVQRGISVGDQVFFAPRTDHCKFVDVENLMRLRGSDASWEHDKEPPPSCVDFSDDEEERSLRRTKKNLVRNRDQTGPGCRESAQKKPRMDNYFSRSSEHHYNRQAHQQPNDNNKWNNQNSSQHNNRWNNQGPSRSSGFAQPFARGQQDHLNAFPPSRRQKNFENGGNRQQPPPGNPFYSAPPSPTPAYFTAPPPCPSPLSGVPPPTMSPMSMPPPPPSPHPVCPSPVPWDTAPFLPSTALPPHHVSRQPPPSTAGHLSMARGSSFFRSSYGNAHSDPSNNNVQFSRPPPSGPVNSTPELTGTSSLWRSASHPNFNQWSQPPPSQQTVTQSYQPMTSSPVKFGSATNLNSCDMSRPPPCNPALFGSAAQFPRIFPNSGESGACSARDSYPNAASAVNAHPANFFNQPPPPGTNFQQNLSIIPNAFGSVPPPPPPSERRHDSSHGDGLHFSQMNFGSQGYYRT